MFRFSTTIRTFLVVLVISTIIPSLTWAQSINADIARLRSLCKAHNLDFPIRVNENSPWAVIEAVQKLLSDYLTVNLPWVANVHFNGSTIKVRRHGPDGAAGSYFRSQSFDEVSSLLQGAFEQQKNIEIDYVVEAQQDAKLQDDIPVLKDTAIIDWDDLEVRYVKETKVNYDNVWTVIVNTVAEFNLDCDTNTMVRVNNHGRDNYGSLSIRPKILEHEGRVWRYFLTIKMSDPSEHSNGEKVQIDTKVSMENRWASQGKFTSFPNIEGNATLDALRQTHDIPTGSTVLNAIVEKLKR